MTLSLDSLTEPQREAVEHVDGPMLVLAGPGSGKTRVVTHRVARLLEHGVRPSQIVALTFTNKAAEEMRSRVEQLTGGTRVWMSTFHRFCSRLLRQHAELVGLEGNFTIYDTSDSRRVLEDVIDDCEIGSFATTNSIAHEISRAKGRLLLPSQISPESANPLEAVTARVYGRYQAALMSANAVDFDDLLLHIATLMRDNPELRREWDERYRYILVDEYQDTNLAQYMIARGLSIDHPNLAVTGDPDQSIYSWRGANLGNILDFERDYPNVRVVRLEQNYRSTKRILFVAQTLISHNRMRKEKDLFTDNPEGARVRLTRYATARDEAEGIASRIASEVRAGRREWSDFALFLRVNALSRTFEEAFHSLGVPFQMVSGQEFYQRQEVKDLLGYLQLLNNPRDNVALKRIINVPARKIGKTTVGRLQAYAERRKFSMLDAAREAGMIEGLSKQAAVHVARFVSLYDRLSLLSAKPVAEIISAILAETEYANMYRDTEEDNDRLANIEELRRAAHEFDNHCNSKNFLEEYLENTSLVNETDELDASSNRVKLMTLHAAKGLEFPAVFIAAIEDGILPHKRRNDDTIRDAEEERRLLFVGITRARENLYLSYARNRDFRGRVGPTIESSFLWELPREEFECEDFAPWSTGHDARLQRGPARLKDLADDVTDDRDMAGEDEDLPDVDFGDMFEAPAIDRSREDARHESADSLSHADDLRSSASQIEDPSRVMSSSEERSHGQSSAGAGESIQQREPAESSAAGGSDRGPQAFSMKLMTAAQLAAKTSGDSGGEQNGGDPLALFDDFYEGLPVVHPEYGAGKIMSLTGVKPRRRVQVEFATAGRKTFMLELSSLRPARG